MAISLLLGTTLAPPVPGVILPAAEAADAHPTLSERLFRVEWVSGASPPDQFRIVGYVYNDYGEDAANVQLRISEVDASGRAFFDLRVPGTTSSYRVAVESFDFLPDPWTTETTEQLLAAAGFEQKLADSPEKLANLQRLTPARKLVPEERNGQLYYVYADPALCKCMFVGTAAQYERARQQELANDQLIAVQEHLSVPILWQLWAPWPWF